MSGFTLRLVPILALLLIGLGLHSILTESGGLAWGIFPYPSWAGWIQLVCGICIGFLSIRVLLRGEGRPRVTEEDIAQSKAVLERMYLKDYGILPDYPADTEEYELDGVEDKSKTKETYQPTARR